MTALYRAAIGPINTDYYLPIFNRFEASGRIHLSWNWSACVYTFNWLVFRHLRRAALAYAALVLAVPALMLGLGRLLFQWSESDDIAVLLICLALSFVIPGAFGNAIFHRYSRKKMDAALAASATLKDACAWLAKHSGTRRRFIQIVLANAILACVALAAYLLIAPESAPSSEPLRPMASARASRSTPIQLIASEPVATATQPVSAPTPTPTLMQIPPAPPSVTASSSASAPMPNAAHTPVLATTATKSVKPSQGVNADPGRFFVNVGLFESASNAHNAYRKIVAAGLPALARTVKAQSRRLIRVRAGPFATQSQADEAAVQIRSLSLEAVVVPP